MNESVAKIASTVYEKETFTGEFLDSLRATGQNSGVYQR